MPEFCPGHTSPQAGSPGPSDDLSQLELPEPAPLPSTSTSTTSSGPFPCLIDGCDLVFESKDKRRRHIRKHTKPTKCPKPGCDVGGDYGKAISRHVWSKHRAWANDENYPKISGECDICKQPFERRDYVNRHKREVHDGKKRQRGPRG